MSSAGDHPLASINRAQLLQALQQTVPAHCIIETTESQRPFECDALTIYRELPLSLIHI